MSLSLLSFSFCLPFVSLFFVISLHPLSVFSSSSFHLVFSALSSSLPLFSFDFSSSLSLLLLWSVLLWLCLWCVVVVVVVVLFSVCGTLENPEHASVCPFKTSLCVPAPRPHVQNMWTCCWYSMCVVVLLCLYLSLFFPHVCLHQINTCVKTGHNTCTCQVTQCVNELRAHLKNFDLSFGNSFHDDKIRIRIH